MNGCRHQVASRRQPSARIQIGQPGRYRAMLHGALRQHRESPRPGRARVRMDPPASATLACCERDSSSCACTNCRHEGQLRANGGRVVLQLGHIDRMLAGFRGACIGCRVGTDDRRPEGCSQPPGLPQPNGDYDQVDDARERTMCQHQEGQGHREADEDRRRRSQAGQRSRWIDRSAFGNRCWPGRGFPGWLFDA